MISILPRYDYTDIMIMLICWGEVLASGLNVPNYNSKWEGWLNTVSGKWKEISGHATQGRDHPIKTFLEPHLTGLGTQIGPRHCKHRCNIPTQVESVSSLAKIYSLLCSSELCESTTNIQRLKRKGKRLEANDRKNWWVLSTVRGQSASQIP